MSPVSGLASETPVLSAVDERSSPRYGVDSPPLVSVVLPVYNSAATLRESLESILAQTYARTEIVVMDDASTDSTAEIVAEYGDRVCSYRQPRNRGNYPNVNDGVTRARGKYVAVYHADDVYDPRIVEREVELLEVQPEVGAVFAADIFIDARGRELGRLNLPREIMCGVPLGYPTVLNALLTYKNSFLRCPSSMVRRSVYEAIGPYRPDLYGIASDLDMWLRIARHHQLAVLGEHLFRYRRGHGSSSDYYHTLRTEPEGYFAILDGELDHGGRIVARPAALRAFEAHRAEDHLMRAVSHYILGQRAQARRVLAEIDPRRILASSVVQRDRLLTLYALMLFLVRVPTSQFMVDAFAQRWHRRISA